jgi:hypothetical protein
MGKPWKTIHDVLERLVICEPTTLDTGCWEWPGATGSGYGRTWLGGKLQLVHRLVYVHFRGEVGAGLEMDHLCRNTSCANPWHLQAVTHLENLMRAATAATLNAAKSACPRCCSEYSFRGDGRRVCNPCASAGKRARREREKIGFLSQSQASQIPLSMQG